MAVVVGYPDEPLRTLATEDPYLRRAEFGEAGPATYLVDDARQVLTLTDVTWTG